MSVLWSPCSIWQEDALEQEWLERLMAFSGDPAALLAGLFLLSLFADSAAAIVAALLVAQGLLPAGITALALPIFLIIGDGALYLFGYLAHESRLLARYTPKKKIAHAAHWLKDRRTLVLALTRALPGTRSLVFVGFGYLHMPLVHFLVVNAIAATLWSLILMLFVAVSATWFEDAGMLPSLAAGIITAVIILVPAYILAARAKPLPPPSS